MGAKVKKMIMVILIFVISFASSHDLFINHITAESTVSTVTSSTQSQPTTSLSQVHHLLHFLAILDETPNCCHTFAMNMSFSHNPPILLPIFSKVPHRPPIA